MRDEDDQHGSFKLLNQINTSEVAHLIEEKDEILHLWM